MKFSSQNNKYIVIKADSQVNPYHLMASGPNCMAMGSISGINI